MRIFMEMSSRKQTCTVKNTQCPNKNVYIFCSAVVSTTVGRLLQYLAYSIQK